MDEGLFHEGSAAARWRPTVEPYRPPRIPKVRTRSSLPGQRYLPGLAPFVADVLCCPNCGGTAFDADGDCTACWEPRVAPQRQRKADAPARRRRRN
jgi:fermentation-respiration switch protein FrsA (DUF1100 family)